MPDITGGLGPAHPINAGEELLSIKLAWNTRSGVEGCPDSAQDNRRRP